MRAVLRNTLVDGYDQLRKRLTARLGSIDLAGEALHETWLRLQDGPALAPVDNQQAYLFRAALNNASKLGAAQRRVLGTGDIDDLLSIADDAPGPERIAIARNEIAHLRRTLHGLTRRQREIFLESFTGDATHAELADRYGVTIRTVQSDLRQALIHVARGMAGNDRFAIGTLRVSRK
ncbi:sigma-70 family RNA polymerase sigma factor [Sphingosinicellaceae bacterium]|nr:sigma-70 family RNA polymerase sigma factor [Sphingosinicellaceae bacterium]